MRLLSLSSSLKSFTPHMVWHCTAARVQHTFLSASVYSYFDKCDLFVLFGTSRSLIPDFTRVSVRLVQQALRQVHPQKTHILLHAANIFSHNADGCAVLGVFLD